MEEETVRFTSRETDILHMTAIYATNEEICEELHIGWHTLMSHLQNIRRKLRLPRRKKELIIKYAIDNGYGKRATPA